MAEDAGGSLSERLWNTAIDPSGYAAEREKYQSAVSSLIGAAELTLKQQRRLFWRNWMTGDSRRGTSCVSCSAVSRDGRCV